MEKDKWLKISTIKFDRTVRRITSYKDKMRFYSRTSGICCYRCNRVTPFKDCPNCGETEYETGTSSGYIGFYCVKCGNGFTTQVCSCGERSTISSIMIREKAPPTVFQIVWSGIVKAIKFPFFILLKVFRLLLKIAFYPIKIILAALKYPFRKISDFSAKGKLSREEVKKFRLESEKWTMIFYQRYPGWIGSGFPARALYELECAAEKGNLYALRSLEQIFQSENGVNKARAAQHLKNLTGKDYMPQSEIDIKIRTANTIKYPLPPAPDDLP
ncbi:MAG: hypothetical protein JXN63_07050 [Candidatus Delongbacteria bacterium]|nr:hypothetical protein [Candidatus Delongbacteria bacterium]